jgi:hypothetical protein
MVYNFRQKHEEIKKTIPKEVLEAKVKISKPDRIVELERFQLNLF